MSPRAACRLEALGFAAVFDYTAGIQDWKAAGLSVEGNEDPGPQVIDATRADVPAFDGTTTVEQAAAGADEWADAFVIDCDRVVVGRVRGFDAAPGTRLSEIMEVGPSTVRPDESLHAVLKRMERRPTPLVAVSDPQGRLIGALRLEDARSVASGDEAPRQWLACDSCPGRWIWTD